MQISSLLDTESLTQGLAKETRSERMEQRVKPSMKQIIEYAATLSGTDTSEFVSTAAFQAAMHVALFDLTIRSFCLHQSIEIRQVTSQVIRMGHCLKV